MASNVDSVCAVRDRFVDILKRLTVISLTSKDRKERDEADRIKKNMEKIEFIVNFDVRQLYIKRATVEKYRPQRRFEAFIN